MLKLTELQKKLNASLEEFENYMKEIKKFDEYYSSEKWLSDYDMLNLGLIPEDIGRYVLDQDIPYDVLGENYYLAKRMKKLVKKLEKF